MSKTSVRRLKAAERRNLVFAWKVAGMAYHVIASKMVDEYPTLCWSGYGARDAHKDVLRCMADMPAPENVDQLRQMECARLDELLNAWWEKALTQTKAAELVLKILVRRACMLGLDEPQKKHHLLSIEDVHAKLDIVLSAVHEAIVGRLQPGEADSLLGDIQRKLGALEAPQPHREYRELPIPPDDELERYGN